MSIRFSPARPVRGSALSSPSVAATCPAPLLPSPRAALLRRKPSAHRDFTVSPTSPWQRLKNATAPIAGQIPATLRARLFAVSCLALIANVAACPSAGAQAGEWAWMGGSSTGGQPGVYGTLRVPAAGNIPANRQSPVSWTDSSGHLWMFGGVGFDANENEYVLNDLWEFNPSTNEWAWMGGSSTGGQPGVYGTLGVAAPGNIPGSRFAAVSWADSSGHLWLLGGAGLDANGTIGDLNDLWQFTPSTNEWAWMGGSSTVPGPSAGQPGVYGTLGVPAPGNIPGGRIYAVSWTDSNAHFWLFGGASDIGGNFDDLWEFNPSTNEWAWMGGSSTGPQFGGQPGVYGTLGTPAPGNIPGRRYGAVSWTDSSGHLWLFGGAGDGAHGTIGDLNDLWQFNPSTNEWAWMGGSATAICDPEGFCGQPGVYGTLGTPAAGNNPGSRLVASSWTDSSGNLWLFGGGGFDANGTPGSLNDLWQFNPSTNEWAWMGGSSTVPNCGSFGWCGQPGVYGTLGTPAPGNIPGGRGQAVGWTDSSGHLWLFGGGIEEEADNDLWEYWPPAATTTRITFAPLTSPVVYGVPSIHLEATSASGAEVHFRVVSGPGFVHHHSWLTITGAGTVVVAAYLDGGPDVTQSIVVDKATPTIRLESWPHSIAQGQWIVFKARLRADCDREAGVDFDRRHGASCDRPTGKVTFFDGETRLGEGWVHGDGEAVFATDSLRAGTNSITAVYGGDENYTGVSSTPLNITVQ